VWLDQLPQVSRMGRRPLRPKGARPEPVTEPVSVQLGPRHGAALLLVPEDRDWIERIRSGNHLAFEALYRRSVRPLTAFAHRYVQSLSGAQSVVDEVFARLWTGRYSWAFHGTVRGHLFASAHRVALEVLNRTHRDARWHAGLPPDGPTFVPDPRGATTDAGGVAFEELEASVSVAIARLPGRSRVAAYMRWTDQLTQAEIATVLGMNVRTVQSQLMPSVQVMRRRLGSPHDMINAWSTSPTTRESSEGAEPFTAIDVERLERYLAGECTPVERAALESDVVAASGEPRALEAMQAAWGTPRQVIERLVNEEEAWRGVARRLALPHVADDTETLGRFDARRLDPRRYMALPQFPRLPRPSIAIPNIRPRSIAAFVAVVGVALAAIAGVWALASHQANAGAATRPATSSSTHSAKPHTQRKHKSGNK
jgi:RNA polymerase sigma-70 factor (ECF subfamily)